MTLRQLAATVMLCLSFFSAAAMSQQRPVVDVSGIAIGMSAEEAKTAAKARNLAGFEVMTGELKYLDVAADRWQRVPNAEFVNSIHAYEGDSVAMLARRHADYEALIISLTPEPGRERVVRIDHAVEYTEQHAILESTFLGALLEKYGKPAFQTVGSVIWRYDSLSGPFKSKPLTRSCMSRIGNSMQSIPSMHTNLAMQSKYAVQSEIDDCGAVIIQASYGPLSGTAPAGQRVITEFKVSAYSPTLALEGGNVGRDLITQAEKEAKRAGSERAAEQPKPAL